MKPSTFWKKCNACKKPIPYGGDFLRCGVSSCNTKRTSYAFCSMSCWSAHVPTMGHRNPWAEDEKAPTQQEARQQEELAARPPQRTEPDSVGTRRTVTRPADSERTVRRRVSPHPSAAHSGTTTTLRAGNHEPNDVLVVVSKLKAYIRARSDCKTSATVNDVLSDIIRSECDRAIHRALADGRSTVMGRDFKD